mgnify:CR=1 FL=1
MENTLENLTQYIMDKAQSEVQIMLDVARKESENALAAATLKYDQMMRSQEEQIVRQSEQELREAVQFKTVNLKKERTKYAEQLIDGLFEAAHDELCKMPAADFLHFVSRTIECMHFSGNVTIVLGEKSAAALDQQQRAILAQEGDGYRLTLSPNKIPNQGGFVLEKPPVEYSFLFSDLLAEIKKHEMPNLLKRLLG